MTGMLRAARLFYGLLLQRKGLGERVCNRTILSLLLDTVQILDGSGGGLVGYTNQMGELLIQFDPGLYAYLDHAEKQHGNKGKGEREQPTFPEEITEVQIVKKAADSIAKFAAAKGSALLFGRKRCIGRRQLKLFHKEEHSFLEQ